MECDGRKTKEGKEGNERLIWKEDGICGCARGSLVAGARWELEVPKLVWGGGGIVVGKDSAGCYGNAR
jgi:hypothetical protein